MNILIVHDAPAPSDVSEQQTGEDGYECVRQDFNHGATVLASVLERQARLGAFRAHLEK
jgi:hypothetical protein